ncbi:MAG: uncharacterized protein JWO33_1631 [Caulobacteraceae bacterium]|nr:uncharacterized protein [Caulobacteraceae bacterium]
MSTTFKSRLKAFGLSRSIARISREAAAMTADQKDALVRRVADKTLVFCVASGRSGTQSLAKIFEVAPGVHATHEGVPAFQDVMRPALESPTLACDFLLTRKLPAIADVAEEVYLESSHVFAKGFLPPMLKLGLRPKLIFLKRDPRKIALSLERIGATPLRTEGGRGHFISPADPSMLPVAPWDDFTDYQLCYWYALETIRRQQVLYEMAVRSGCTCRYQRIEDLRTPADVWALMASLGLGAHRGPEAEAAMRVRVGRAFNLKEKSPPLRRVAAELDAQEQMVAARVQTCMPELNVSQMIRGYLSAAVVETPDGQPEPAVADHHGRRARMSA